MSLPHAFHRLLAGKLRLAITKLLHKAQKVSLGFLRFICELNQIHNRHSAIFEAAEKSVARLFDSTYNRLDFWSRRSLFGAVKVVINGFGCFYGLLQTAQNLLGIFTGLMKQRGENHLKVFEFFFGHASASAPI